MEAVRGLERIAMGSIALLPERDIRPGNSVSDLFLERNVTTFHAACQWVKDLPYGCNSNFENVLALFADNCGTCFSKHGVIALLARELTLDVHKYVGIYRLTDDIVTGVSALFEPYGVSFVPQMHCFLEYRGAYVDLTDGNANGKNCAIELYDDVFRVEPEPVREELQRRFAAQLVKYAAVEPRLAAIPMPTLFEILTQCGRLQLDRK